MEFRIITRIRSNKDYRYRLISSNYWRWHIKWNILMATLLGIPTIGFSIENQLDAIGIIGIILVYLCIFILLAKVTYDTDRWDRCTKCGLQYIGEERHCSGCGIVREGNTKDGITWRLDKEEIGRDGIQNIRYHGSINS